MNDTIEEYENEAYCVMRIIDSNKPVIQESWFPTGMNAHGLRRSYGDDIIGRKLEYEHGWGFYFRAPNGSRITVPTTSKYAARFVEVPIDPPKSRLPLEWRYGQWWKETKRGWVEYWR